MPPAMDGVARAARHYLYQIFGNHFTIFCFLYITHPQWCQIQFTCLENTFELGTTLGYIFGVTLFPPPVSPTLVTSVATGCLTAWLGP